MKMKRAAHFDRNVFEQERRTLIGETEIRRLLASFLTRVAALGFAVAVSYAAHTVAHVGSNDDGGDPGHGVGSKTTIASTR
jgi:hypothetical protein